MSRAVIRRSVAVLIYLAIIACKARGQSEQEVHSRQVQAVLALGRYVRLRTRDADWSEYSKLITWPDEPSWDCKWVARSYRIGPAANRGPSIAIPVVYKRLGLFCYDFDFKPEPKVVTVDYELVKRPNGWKVNAPIPDYPDVGADVLLNSLTTLAKNANETSERRAQAEATARKISDAENREVLSR